MDGIDKPINCFGSILFCDLCQVSVALCGGGRAVAEESLDMAKTQAPLEQMGCKGMPQGMNGDFF
jgi:hypothetical protein